MRAILFLLLLSALSACATSAPKDRIPFVPLEAPQVLRSAADVVLLKRTDPVVDADTRTISTPEEPLVDGNATLLKRSGEQWLAYALPLFKDRQNHFELQRITSDGRFLIAEQRTTEFTRGHEYLQVDLYLIDLEQLTYASLTTLLDNFEWEFDDKGVQHDHRTRDSSVVSITSSHIHLVNGCTVNGDPVPCESPSISYLITTEALVPDSSISISPVADGASQLPAPPGGWDRYTLRRNQRLCPGRTPENMDRLLVNDAARTELMQHTSGKYAGATLRFGDKLPFDNGLRITLLCERDDDHDLLWLTYDRMGQLQGVDTLASTFGDGQYEVQECIYLNPYGQLLVESVYRETLRDEVDTMAYRCDTLVYEPVVEGTADADENGELKQGYQLRRRAMDLTRCWVEKHAVNDRGPFSWHSVRELIPADRRVLQAASGDLDRDGADDHVFVLTNAADDGPRDLLIAFTAPDRGRFVLHDLLQGFLPDKKSGGFHDPIGEEGISGIRISADTLVITQFGGSAWKYTSTDKYVHDASRKAFYLVESGGRSFHAPSEDRQAEELQELEALSNKQKLNKEQAARYAELKELAEKATWKVTKYLVGTRPMAQ
ncbi:MAG TPA: hypothetical protein PLB89_06860 [Flavobacteriales bacterium]|nr:hypothetical protein [Flavobacteriales bacterium]